MQGTAALQELRHGEVSPTLRARGRQFNWNGGRISRLTLRAVRVTGLGSIIEVTEPPAANTSVCEQDIFSSRLPIIGLEIRSAVLTLPAPAPSPVIRWLKRYNASLTKVVPLSEWM